MEMDPQARAIGELLGAGLDLSQMDLATVRKMADDASGQGPKPEVSRVEDRLLPGPEGDLPVRVYGPEPGDARPVLVYFHGGGWTLCSIETHDITCRQLANDSGCVVVSVDYRLAPEHPFPAAAEDAYAATCWVAENASQLGADPERIGVGGDSAGGNLAAVVALMGRDRQGPALRHQLLVYPVTDCSFETGSYRDNAEGPLLTRAMMQAFWDFYLPDANRRADPYVSPLRAESLEGLPPACVITAGYDPLRDEGDAYAERLTQAGVAVVHRRYDAMIHGFFGLDVLDDARKAQAEAAREVRTHLGG